MIVLALVASVFTRAAYALVTSATNLDGPSGDVLDLGGVAMAEDGTGGAVWRRREGGFARIYAAQYTDGAWRAPQRIDAGQGFDSYWPRIGAASGGRLMVIWVAEFGAGVDRMFYAELGRGARRFQRPLGLDLDVGEANATYPSLAMNSGGEAYLAYRQNDPPGGGVPPGYVTGEVRVARFDGGFWSLLGPVDRNPAAFLRSPTAGNSPKVGIGEDGRGVVAFQEPDEDFVDRVWARRLFGGVVGNPLIVGTQSLDGKPLRAAADSFDLDVAGFGRAAVALRQQPSPGSSIDRARVLVNLLPDQFNAKAGNFLGARVADGGSRAVGPPSVAVAPRDRFLTVFGSINDSVALGGNDNRLDKPERLDDGSSSVPGDPVVDTGLNGAAVAAWKLRSGGRGGVAIQERRADEVSDVTRTSAARGGGVNELKLGGSGLGDAIVGLQQGSDVFAQIAVAIVDAPPTDFTVTSQSKWNRARDIKLEWDSAANAIGKVRYTLTLDDEALRENVSGTRVKLRKKEVPDGAHQIQVIATDRADQETSSQVGKLRVDRRAPRVKVTRRGRRVIVRLSDGKKGEASGVKRSSTTISFGDGTRAKRKASVSHAYARGGTYRVVVKTRDAAGNKRTARRKIKL